MKRIAKKRATNPEIPTASMGDIAFLLIIFFMVSTIFRPEHGLRITLPEADATERLRLRRNASSIWMDRSGKTTIDDNLVTSEIVTSIMSEKVIDNPELVVMLQADRDVPYGFVTDVLEALKSARALKLTFATGFRTKAGG